MQPKTSLSKQTHLPETAEDLEVLQILKIGNYNYPVLTVGVATGYLNIPAANFAQEKHTAKSILFSRLHGQILVSFPGIMSEMRAYAITYKPKDKNRNRSGYNVFSVKGLKRQFNTMAGHYRINTEDEIFMKDLVWYPLELIEDNIAIMKKAN